MSTKTHSFRSLEGFRSMSDAVLLARATAALNGMTGNTAFPAPPIDMNTFKTLVTNYGTAIAEALDGGSKAIAARNELHGQVAQALRTQLVYVETIANGNTATFMSSGFVLAAGTRTPAQTPPPPAIRKIVQGPNSGQLQLSIGGTGRGSADLHYAVFTGTTPATWILVSPVSRRGLVTVSNLTPGTTYAFQVRALNAAGYSDWSDSVTRMVI